MNEEIRYSENGAVFSAEINRAIREIEENEYLSREEIDRYVRYINEARDLQDLNEILSESRQRSLYAKRDEAVINIRNRAYISNQDIENFIADVRNSNTFEEIDRVIAQASERDRESRRNMGFESLGNRKAIVLEHFREYLDMDASKRLELRERVYNSTDIEEINRLDDEAMVLNSGADRSYDAPTPVPEPVSTAENTSSDSLDNDLEVYRNMGLYEDLTSGRSQSEDSNHAEPDLEDPLDAYRNMGLYNDVPSEDVQPAVSAPENTDNNEFDNPFRLSIDEVRDESTPEVISEPLIANNIEDTIEDSLDGKKKEIKRLIENADSLNDKLRRMYLRELDEAKTENDLKDILWTIQVLLEAKSRNLDSASEVSSTENNTVSQDDIQNRNPEIELEEDNDIDDEIINTFRQELHRQNPEPISSEAPSNLPVPVSQDPVIENEVRETGIRTLDAIIDDLTRDLKFKEKDNRKYTAKNIKVGRSFLGKLHQGNYLYNIFGTVSSIFTPILNGAAKLYGIVSYSPRIKKNVEELKTRLDNLNDADLKVLYEAYRGNVLNSRFGLNSVMNNLIGQRLRAYVMDNVARLNEDLTNRYQSLYEDVQEILALTDVLNRENITEAEYSEAQNRINELTSGKAEFIRGIRETQNELDTYWLAGGGIHGLEEDIKAARTKMSLVGKRFAKRPKFNSELMHEQRTYKDAEENAINNGDDLGALIGFLSYEKLLSDNTKTSLSIFGRRNVGARNYNPLGKELDYRDDPFARYVLGSIANATITMSIYTGIKTAIAAKSANAHNVAQAQTIKGYGNQQAARTDTLVKGQEAQINQANLTNADLSERMVLDKTNWSINGSEYRALDDANHTRFNELYESTQESLRGINQAYNSGAITGFQALDQMKALNSTVQADLISVMREYQPILQQYAVSHPQYHLEAITGAVDYFTQNSSAILNSAQAQVEILQIASKLQNVQAAELQVNVIPTILAAVASAGLTATVVNDVQKYIDDKELSKTVGEIRETINETDDIDKLRDLASRIAARQTTR